MSRRQNIKKIDSLIRKLDDYSGGDWDPEKTQRYIDSLLLTIDEAMPSYLYKYRSTDEMHLNSLQNEKLYLSKPVGFNDPTESLAFINQDRLFLMAINIPNESCLFDHSDTDDWSNNFLLKRTELLNKSLEYIKHNRERVKVLCLSEVIDSPLMWSHYAEDHKGFAIRYNTKLLEIPECILCENEKRCFCRRPGKPLFPVIYKDERYDASAVALARAMYLEFNDGNEDFGYPFPLLTVLQKSRDWEYEREWRIICNNTDISFFTLIPDAIFLGERIGVKLALELSRIAREKNLSLFKMRIDYFSNDFKLYYDEWTHYSDEEIELCLRDQ